MLKILFVGDIVGSRGAIFAESVCRRLKRERGIDLCIVNGENSADGNGITPHSMETLFTFADVVTTGNHCFRRREIMGEYDRNDFLLRPANYPEGVAGKGCTTVDMGRCSVMVINIMGTSFMEPLDNPFSRMDELLTSAGTRNIIVDFHAEASGEKRAMGFFLDGRASAVIGTHTHVQTADETILPKGTAYITDAGMCGTELSVLGVESQLIIEKMRFKTPVKFKEAEGAQILCGVLVTLDEKSGRAIDIERIQVREGDSRH